MLVNNCNMSRAGKGKRYMGPAGDLLVVVGYIAGCRAIGKCTDKDYSSELVSVPWTFCLLANGVCPCEDVSVLCSDTRKGWDRLRSCSIV